MSEPIQNPAAGQTDSPGRRAAAYWFSDGLPETVFGAALLIVGGLGIFWCSNDAGAWTTAVMVAAVCGFLLLFLYDRPALDFLKTRLTYPRTGYVRPPEEPEPPSAEIISILNPKRRDWNVTLFRRSTVYIFLVTSLWVHNAKDWWACPSLMTSAALGIYAFNRLQAHWYSWWSVLPIALAGWASLWLDLPRSSRQFLPLLIGGAWLLARGAWTLARYLRANPRHPVAEPAPMDPSPMEPASHE